MHIDSHQHFWIYDPVEYDWIGPGLKILQQDFLPSHLHPLLNAAGIDACVAVQARQTLEETAWLLRLADNNPWIRGVVGWVDLGSPDVEKQIEPFCAHPCFVGVRHIVQSEPDAEFLLRPDFQRGITVLEKAGLAYDLLITPRQLPAAAKLARLHPNQRFVLDHLAKPLIKTGVIQPWANDLRRLAQSPNVACKLSGIVTEADWNTWHTAEFTPYLDIALEAFSPERLMFGSDWPVCLLASPYARVHQLVKDTILTLSTAEQAQIFGATALRFYQIPLG